MSRPAAPAGSAAAAGDAMELAVLWGRLVAVADEAAATLVRTAFSTTLREANDYVCMLLDAGGLAIADNSTAAPSFVGTLPLTLRHVLAKYPPGTWRPGDVVITNDPWLASGHLPDVTLLAPIFHRGRLAAFAASMAHHADVGGLLWSADTAEIFEEGLRIPICRLYREGVRNDALYEVLETNVRVPGQVLGDLAAQLAALDTLGRGLAEVVEDAGLDDLTPVAAAMQRRAEEAMREAIRAIPPGRYAAEVEMDGFERPLVIRLAIEVAGSEMRLDYAGTSRQVSRAINVPLNNTFSHSAYALKAILDPRTPRNDGSYRPISVTAPDACLLNARFPAAVNARHVTFLFLSAAIFQALAPVMPDRVIAECGSPQMQLTYYGIDREGEPFIYVPFDAPGMGARPTKDGLSATPYAHNTGGASVEVVENMAPLLVWRKALVPDSGGPGRFRGGLGQELLVENRAPGPLMVSAIGDRVDHPARGILGGRPGKPAALLRGGTTPMNTKGRSLLQPGERILVRTAGGGGYGPPEAREAWRVAADVHSGLVTLEGTRDYGRPEGDG